MVFIIGNVCALPITRSFRVFALMSAIHNCPVKIVISIVIVTCEGYDSLLILGVKMSKKLYFVY